MIKDKKLSMKDIEDILKTVGKNEARKVYLDNIQSGKYSKDDTMELKMRKKQCRSNSGVLVITVVLAPSKFSCSHNCHYCPNQPGTARSYLDNEPAVARAKQVEYDAVKQMYSRMRVLEMNGHIVQKLEIIVLGGTFSDYPRWYQEEFTRDLYYAANTYTSIYGSHNDDIRERKTLLEEQLINEDAQYKVIGLSLETRPDKITKVELMRFRNLGCTRVQIGVQHIDNEILKIVNRGHTVEQSIKAIKMLKNYGFKVDIHVMPDLPGATPEKDKRMLETVLTNSDFKPDYMKIYPCLDVEYTTIREWKKTGTWKPYAEADAGEAIIDVCLHAKRHSQYYTRFNRIQRDFCEENKEKQILGYASKNLRSNFRQVLLKEAENHNIVCKCIRCCEVKAQPLADVYIHIDKFKASDGWEYFINAASKDRSTLYGFVRLRIGADTWEHCAMIRELHVYGTLCDLKKTFHQSTQHKGLGALLMSIAEAKAYMSGVYTLAVISGVGVRNYYRRLGYRYTSHGHYMIKSINFFHCLFFFCRTIYKCTTTHVISLFTLRIFLFDFWK